MAKKGQKAKEADRAAELDNQRRELFCRYFTQNDEMFNNATLSYAEAYEYELDELSQEAVYEEIEDEETGEIRKGKLIEPSEYDKAYNVCSVQGHRLLRNTKVQERIVALRNELLKDEVVDSELSKVIKQNKDFTPKVAAIKEYNKLRGRIIDQTKVTHVQKLDMDDIRSVISVLPQGRQDQFYATITDILAEAELLRSGGKTQINNPQ
jgi:hypothetical protein